MDIIAKPNYLTLVKTGKGLDCKEIELLKLIEKTLINELEQKRTIHNTWASGDESKEGLLEYNDQVKNLLQLGTHSEMIKVWRKVLSWTDEHNTEDRFCFLQTDIKNIIISISQALNYKNNWEELTLRKRRPTYNNIIKKMETLANELKHYDLDQKDYVSYKASTNECFMFFDKTYSDPSPSSASTTFREVYENRTGIQISDMLLDHASKLKEQERYRYTLYKNSKSGKDARLRKFANYMAVENANNFGAVHESII